MGFREGGVERLDSMPSCTVSKQFQAAFSESDLNYHLLKFHYPRVRELRGAENPEPDWSEAFKRAASRYQSTTI